MLWRRGDSRRSPPKKPPRRSSSSKRVTNPPEPVSRCGCSDRQKSVDARSIHRTLRQPLHAIDVKFGPEYSDHLRGAVAVGGNVAADDAAAAAGAEVEGIEHVVGA